MTFLEWILNKLRREDNDDADTVEWEPTPLHIEAPGGPGEPHDIDPTDDSPDGTDSTKVIIIAI